MTPHDARSATPGMPGSGDAPRSRPVDLCHLSRQTMGDRELEREVLQLFVRQAEAVGARILEAESAERLSLAHSLKGSARNVGAFAIAQCAAGIESRPADRLALRRLALLIDEVRDFVAAISR